MIGAKSVTHTLVYTYNGDGVRVAMAVDGAETRFVVDQVGLPQVLVEISGTERVTYTYGMARLAQWKAGVAEWFLDDALGSVRQVVDDDGDVVLARDYAPFGSTSSGSGAGRSGYGFTGEQYDRYMDKIFLRARWYDGGTGRFLSQDPWAGSIYQPSSLHKYLYVSANPINRVDPSGLKGIMNWDQYRYLYLEWHEGEPNAFDITDLVSEGTMPEDIYNQIMLADTVEDLPAHIRRSSLFAILMNFEGNPFGKHPGIGMVDVTCYVNPLPGSTEDYNRYDWLISGWTDYWNWQAERNGVITYKERLDPNLVKAMAYMESRVGNMPNTDRGPYDAKGNEVGMGIMQLTLGAINDLRGKHYLTWGWINVTNQYDPAQNIGGGIRWLFRKYEDMEDKAYWISGGQDRVLSAVQRYYGPRENYPSYDQRVYALYRGGYDPHTGQGWQYNEESGMWEHGSHNLYWWTSWAPGKFTNLPPY